jgi:prevent-host-death family protein
MPATLSSREFNQDTARAKREAAKGPVFVTDRGRPTHVLLSVEEYERLATPRKTLGEMLAWPGAGEIEIEFERDKSPGRSFDFDE